MYYLNASIGGGSLSVRCLGTIDMVVGVNTGKPSERFMAFFGEVAHDLGGVNAKDAIASALECRTTAMAHKGTTRGGMWSHRIDREALHVDCRISDRFTSFGVHPR